MNILVTALEFLIHFDKYLCIFIQDYGSLVYLLLFLIILLETGLVLTPFLPGDSLIFVAGAFASQGYMNIFLLFFLLVIAAVVGDSLNYWIGKFFGERVFAKSRFFDKAYLDKTKNFYEVHGGKTIIYARFMPIVRTFAPFVAGIAKMNYLRFFSFNIIGALIWVSLFLTAGYFLGTIQFVQDNLTLLIVIIIVASIIPPIIEHYRNKRSKI